MGNNLQTSCFAALVLLSSFTALAQQPDTPYIQISNEYPNYFKYKGKTLLLLGGSSDDNLFQLETNQLEKELDEIKLYSGNYVRCTMSSRDDNNAHWPFLKDPASDKYDLTKWDDHYWEKFETLLRLARDRGIIVQIEVWATFDFYKRHWGKNPFNPKNNINYTVNRVKLPEEILSHPIHTNNPFFRSIPSSPEVNLTLLGYQQSFVDKLLSHSLKYGNVLYCMDNETSVSVAWGNFWAEYIKTAARERVNKKVLTTEMWDAWNINHVIHWETAKRPELYDFIEISQNNHKKGQAHWDGGVDYMNRLKFHGFRRPVTNIKIYGSDSGRHGGTDDDAIEKFIRDVFFGSAAARFHRPPSGLGNTAKALRTIRSTRLVTDTVNIFLMKSANDQLKEREENEAYAINNSEKEWLIYFPKEGAVSLELLSDQCSIQWIEIGSGQWTKSKKQKNKNITIENPFDSHAIAVIKPI